MVFGTLYHYYSLQKILIGKPCFLNKNTLNIQQFPFLTLLPQLFLDTKRKHNPCLLTPFFSGANTAFVLLTQGGRGNNGEVQTAPSNALFTATFQPHSGFKTLCVLFCAVCLLAKLLSW